VSFPCEDFNHPSIVQGQIVPAPGVPFPPVPAWETTNASVVDTGSVTVHCALACVFLLELPGSGWKSAIAGLALLRVHCNNRLKFRR